MGAGLRHPLGLTLLIASLLLAGAMRFLPALERWSAEALWVFLLGLLAYAASVIVLHRTPTDPSSPAGNPDESPSDGQPSEDFPGLVEAALRRLNNTAALSKCELLQRLPGTLAATHSRLGKAAPTDPGLLDQAQALREVIVAAIDRLKPPNEHNRAGAPAALQYHILHEEYVLRQSTRYIMTRHSISESTFHRNRREAVSAVARHLVTQEELMVQKQEQR